MSDFVTFYTVLLTIVSLPSLQVHSDPLQSLDIENVWEILRRLQRLENHKKSQNKLTRTTKEPILLEEQQKNQKPFFDDVYNKDFIKLINTIKNNNKLRVPDSKESKQVETEGQIDELNLLRKNNKPLKNILRFIPNLPYVSKQEETSESEEDNDDSALNLQDYSKIFVVLDPKVVAKSKHKEELQDILAQLINSKSIRPKSDKPQPKYKYKGFAVNNNNKMLFKQRRDNGVSKDSKDKVKVRRREGGSASRTAIPYMNYRGDIYEHEK